MTSNAESRLLALYRAAAARPLTDAEAMGLADRLLGFNRAVSKRLGEGCFDNPGLMMLLELFVARLQGRVMTVKALALGSGVPQSTALRWIDRLQSRKLLSKRINRDDRRSALVTIDDSALAVIRSLMIQFDDDSLPNSFHA